LFPSSFDISPSFGLVGVTINYCVDEIINNFITNSSKTSSASSLDDEDIVDDIF